MIFLIIRDYPDKEIMGIVVNRGNPGSELYMQNFIKKILGKNMEVDFFWYLQYIVSVT